MVWSARRKSLVMVAALSLCGVAWGAVKIMTFEDVAEPDDADGMAIMNYKQSQNETMNQIILSGLLPNTPYVIVTDGPDGWCRTTDGYKVKFHDNFFPIAVGNDGSQVTNNKGHLTLHEDAAGDDYSDSDVLVFKLSDWPVPFVVGQEIPVRLIGCNPGASCAARTCP